MIQQIRAFPARIAKMIQECRNLAAKGGVKWIFACDCEEIEQLRF